MKITIIGAGHMGSAIIKGLISVPEYTISAMNPVNPRVEQLAQQLKFQLVHTAAEVNQLQPQVVILTTPAKLTVNVARELASLPDTTVFISAAAGISQQSLQAVLPNKTVARIIPNTPVAVNAGTIGLAIADNTPATRFTVITNLLNQLGDVIQVPEHQLEIIGVIGGCGPAFVDVMMDALSDAAVKYGLDRTTAYQLAASMVKGSGSLAYDSKFAPALLRDQVTSPGGTTIRGVEALEKHGFRYAIMDAVNQANGNSK